MSVFSITRSRSRTINRTDIQWLTVLMLLAQLPHALYLPWWIGICGLAIVGSYFLAWHASDDRWLVLIKKTHVFSLVALLAAVAVRLHYGYFLGRDPCVAFLFLLTACKFAESRNHKDASLLICLCGFLLLTQYFYSQNILAGLFSLPAVIAIGGCLYTLGNHQSSVPVGSKLKLVTKLLLQGIPVAALLFFLFPRLPGPLWSLPDDARAQTGLSNTMTPGSISDLSKSDEVAFRVEFDGNIPNHQDLYWRGPVLTRFDGREWSMQHRLRAIKLPPAPESSISYTVTLQPNYQRWLFALDMPTSLPRQITANTGSGLQQSSVDEPGQGQPLARLTNDRQLLSNKPVSSIIRYRQQSTPSGHFADYDASSVANTQIAGQNAKADAFARKTRSNSASDAAYVEKVLQWFREEPFHYTLQPPLLGHSPIDEFLFESRRGFCEHYASAFTYLMRAAGVPARVVTGYQGGQMNEDYMIVRQSDAHAWSEVWINGSWNRVDPTAAVAPSRVQSGLADSLSSNEPIPSLARKSAGWLRQMQLQWDSLNHDWHRLVVDFNNESQLAIWQKLGFSTPKPWQVVVIVLLFTGIWCLLILRIKLSLPRRKEASQKLWHNYCRRLARAGLPIGKTEGPADYQQRVMARWPEHQPVLGPLTSNLIQLRYGNPDDRQRQQLIALSQKALNELSRSKLS